MEEFRSIGYSFFAARVFPFPLSNSLAFLQIPCSYVSLIHGALIKIGSSGRLCSSGIPCF